MRMSNFDSFVDLVGFQLEKIHSGMIAWMMDTRNSHLSRKDRRQVLKEIIGDEHEIPDDFRVDPYLEANLGKSRCDLVLCVRNSDNTFKHDIVIEAKVDSDAYPEQLERTEECHGKSSTWNGTPHFRLLVLGASQCTHGCFLGMGKTENWKALGAQDCLRIFAPLRHRHSFIDQWLKSLEEEEERKDKVVEWGSVPDGDVGEVIREKGFRGWWHWYYYWFFHLRNSLSQISPEKSWSIYNGRNNTVMNWNNGWLDLRNGLIRGHDPEGYQRGAAEADRDEVILQAYWEFNDNRLTVKLGYKNLDAEFLRDYREEVRQRLNNSKWNMDAGRTGRISGKDGVWHSLSLGAWSFDFRTASPDEVAHRAIDVIDHLNPLLQQSGGA